MPPSELFNTVTSVFREEDWKFVEVDGREVIQAGFEAHHARVDLHVQVYTELTAVSIVSEASVGTIDPARRERLAELIMRANEQLNIGNFEMIWDVGRLLFRATNLFSNPGGDPDIIRGLIHTTIAEMDRVAPIHSLIMQTEGAELAGLDIQELFGREDLIPNPDL
ncbi:MAG: hypothetical protein HKN23_05770 [Verrucomicrobiales bacterium]|nr:hypothetical protein [Verrucomicrobiales bacterium]